MNAFLVCAPSGLGSATANQYREGIQIMGTGSCEKGLGGGLSRMKGNFQVRFLGEAVAAMPLPYPTNSVNLNKPKMLKGLSQKASGRITHASFGLQGQMTTGR